MTLNEIKQTPLFKANAPLVAKAFGEQYVEEFARELLKADPISNNIFDGLQGVDLRYAFKWADSPQGGRAWAESTKTAKVKRDPIGNGGIARVLWEIKAADAMIEFEHKELKL